MIKPKNPQAFPFLIPKTEFMPAGHQPGMTLLDYFAGQALMGLWASPNCPTRDSPSEASEDCAGYCYRQAEAMLAEREKRMK